MKKSKTCPNCQCTEIACVRGTEGEYRSIVLGATLTFSDALTVSSYICLNCGFVESYIDSKSDLMKIKKSKSKKVQML